MQALSHTPYDDQPLKLSPRASSADRFWTGFKADIYAGSGGYTETPGFRCHNITMLIGSPVRTTCRCDGSVSRGLQVPGEFDVVPAGHGTAWIEEGATTWFVANVTPMLVHTAAGEMGIDPDRVAIQPNLHGRDPLVEHICWALAAELRTAEPFGRLYADSLGLALVAQLLRRYAPLVPRRAGPSFSKRRLRQITDYIDDNLAADLSLLELAHVVNLSSSHFKSLFKLSVGMPVHQYVIRRRVERAIDLLLGATLPLSDVALQAGFANQSHMARCMRRLTGLTPGALRN
jgi:AraC family transcriptional regulator